MAPSHRIRAASVRMLSALTSTCSHALSGQCGAVWGATSLTSNRGRHSRKASNPSSSSSSRSSLNLCSSAATCQTTTTHGSTTRTETDVRVLTEARLAAHVPIPQPHKALQRHHARQIALRIKYQ